MTVASTITTPARMSIAAPRNDKAACIGRSFPHDLRRVRRRRSRTAAEPVTTQAAPVPHLLPVGREVVLSQGVEWRFAIFDAPADCDRIPQLHVLARAAIVTKQTDRPPGGAPCQPAQVPR